MKLMGKIRENRNNPREYISSSEEKYEKSKKKRKHNSAKKQKGIKVDR